MTVSKKIITITILIMVFFAAGIFWITSQYSFFVFKKEETPVFDSVAVSRFTNTVKLIRLRMDQNIPQKNISLDVRIPLAAGAQGNEPQALQQCIINPALSEQDNAKTTTTETVDLNKSAIIIMDAWDCHYNGGWFNRAQKILHNELMTLITLADQHNIPIIYATYDNVPLNKAIPVKKKDLVTDNLPQALDFLNNNKVDTLIYAGFSTNYCLLFRSLGMVNMHKNLFYKVYLVRDATIAFEMPSTLENEHAKEVAIDMIESQLGASTTLKEFKAALDSIKAD